MSYNRHVINQADLDPFNIRVRAFKDDNMPDGPENAPAEEVKKWAEHFQSQDKARQELQETIKNADAFIAAHPELVDNEANGKILVNQANTMFGKGFHTIEHFDRAYEYLRAENPDFLKMNEAEVERQRVAAAKARYAADKARRTGPTEEELYSMPLEDLRVLDAVEAHGKPRGWR